MNALSTTWRQLVRRRLWPVAVLLVAALAAVPVLLSREAEVPPPPVDPVAVTAEAGDSIAEPVVAKVTSEDRGKRRRVLGSRKDPFAPAPVKKAAKPKEEAPKTEEPAKGTESTGTSGGGGGGGVVAPAEPAKPKKYYEAGTLVVRFGEATEVSKLQRFTLAKLAPLPDDEFPLLVYMGLTKDGKKAKFLVDAAIEADGDGDCKPHPSACETILLAPGETEFLDVIDPEAAEDATDEERILAQFQLDLVDIKRAGDDDVK
jgi:hypothetical protein